MGLYLNAGLITILVLLVLGGIIRLEAGKRNPWPLLLVAFPIRPLFGGLWTAVGRGFPSLGWPWVAIGSLFLVPAIEEGVKVLPLGLSLWRGWLEDRRGALVAGLSLGTGFGLGGIWYQAWYLSREMPVAFQGPFWQTLGGFGAEEFLSCFFQAAASALLVIALFQGHRWGGYLLAVSYRALGEMGDLLERWGKWSFVAGAWWLVLPIALGMAMLLFHILQTAETRAAPPEWMEVQLRRSNPSRSLSSGDGDEDLYREGESMGKEYNGPVGD